MLSVKVITVALRCPDGIVKKRRFTVELQMKVIPVCSTCIVIVYFSIISVYAVEPPILNVKHFPRLSFFFGLSKIQAKQENDQKIKRGLYGTSPLIDCVGLDQEHILSTKY